MSKTRTQKTVDLHDAHHLLKAFYKINGAPAGLDANRFPMTGVPTWHRKQADKLVREMRGRQIVKSQLSEQALESWEELVQEYKNRSLFWWVDNLPRLLNRQYIQEPIESKPCTIQEFLQAPLLRHKDGRLLENDGRTHRFVVGRSDNEVVCFLTGESFQLCELFIEKVRSSP